MNTARLHFINLSVLIDEKCILGMCLSARPNGGLGTEKLIDPEFAYDWAANHKGEFSFPQQSHPITIFSGNALNF